MFSHIRGIECLRPIAVNVSQRQFGLHERVFIGPVHAQLGTVFFAVHEKSTAPSQENGKPHKPTPRVLSMLIHRQNGAVVQHVRLKPHGVTRVSHGPHEADKIIISPGSLYSSLIPNFLVGGLSSTILKSKAKVIMVVNLMNKAGQTDNFSANDYILELEKYLGKGIIKYAII